MEFRKLGKSGLTVPALSLGTATFGGTNEFFEKWGQTDVKEVLGKAIKGKRDQTLISTKATFQMGNQPNDKGSSRYHLIQALDDSLHRLGTDYIDLYLMHGFDSSTPIEETLATLDTMVKRGKVRYIGCSNFAAWQLMKSLSVSEKLNLEKYIVYQGYYSLIGRDYEQELMPLLEDQGLGLMVWSPLGWGRLTGKIKRGMEVEAGRIKSGGGLGSPPIEEERLYQMIDQLEQISRETGKSIPQIAINWLLQNKMVSNVVIGARNEKQLLANIDAVGWKLSDEHRLLLDEISAQTPIYPHWIGER